MSKKVIAPVICRKTLSLTTILLVLLGLFVFTENAAAQDNVYMFSYFQNPDGSNGLHLAYSLDGRSYHAVNNDLGIVTDPNLFMRDPYVNYGPDGTFRLVYTTGWGSINGPVIDDIGYSSSTNMVNWTTPVHKVLPVTGGQERWAPQIYYDSGNSKYLVYWSTRIGSPSAYLDIYSSTTTDFSTFTTPTLFYSRSSSSVHTLDADIVLDPTTNNYTMFLAGTLKAQGGTNLYGPYSTSTQKITGTSYGSEGPSAIKIGNNWIVYNDHMTGGDYGAVISTDDMATWSEYNSYVSFPWAARHGNVFVVPRAKVDYLIANSPNATPQIEFDNQTTGTQDYLSASNWVGGAVPGTGQYAIIQNGQTATISSSTPGSLTEVWAGENSAGTLNITGGTVTISSTGWLCSGRNDGSAGSVINLSGGTVTTGNSSVGSVGSAASGTINIFNNAALAISSTMYDGETGTGAIVQSGTSTVSVGGSLSLGRWSTGNGSYSISGGTLSQTSSGQRLIVGEQGTGSLTVSGTGLVSCTGGLKISAALSGNGTVHLDGGTILTALVEDGGGTATFHFNGGILKAKNSTTTFMTGLNTADVESGGAVIYTNGFNITIGQALLSGSPTGGLTKQSSGTLTLSASPTYSGSTVVSGGTLLLSSTSIHLPSATAVNLTASGATLNINGGVQTIASLTGAAGSAVVLGSGTLTAGNSDSTVFAGAITSTTGGALTKQGTGTLTLSGTNTFTGAVNFNGGLIKAAGLGNLGGGTALNFNGGGLQFDGVYNPSTRTMTFQSGGATLDTQANNITLTNAIGNNGAGSLTKLGAGTLTLSGTNTFTGAVNFNGGLIKAAALNKIGNGAALNFNGGGLQFDGVYNPSTRIMTFQSGGATLDTQANNITLTNAIGNNGTGGLTKDGSGMLTLTASPLYTGETVINTGQLQLNMGSTTLAAISGQGELIVGSATTSTHLTASSINVGTLTLGVNSRVTISPIAGGPTAQSQTTAVPEPSVWILLLIAAMALYLKRRLYCK
jgi:autotransporter-associated beta strand protein